MHSLQQFLQSSPVFFKDIHQHKIWGFHDSGDSRSVLLRYDMLHSEDSNINVCFYFSPTYLLL
jgi:hypothetical protein